MNNIKYNIINSKIKKFNILINKFRIKKLNNKFLTFNKQNKIVESVNIVVLNFH